MMEKLPKSSLGARYLSPADSSALSLRLEVASSLELCNIAAFPQVEGCFVFVSRFILANRFNFQLLNNRVQYLERFDLRQLGIS
jgi:hypothetical protein